MENFRKEGMQNMMSEEQYHKFKADFTRLVKNREALPLETLQTKYATQYNQLVAEVAKGADLYLDHCIRVVVDDFPTSPRYPSGNEWLEKKIAAILQDERRPGGRFERYRSALIDRLDKEYADSVFDEIMEEIYERLEKEAFRPYQQRLQQTGTICKGCGKPILWKKTPAGKAIPCDPEPVAFWCEHSDPLPKGRIVNQYGQVIACDFSGQGPSTGTGYVPHWATCPKAEQFKGGKAHA